MTESLLGKSIDEANCLIKSFNLMLKGKEDKDNDFLMKKLKIFSNIWKFPMRIKCAALPWYTVKGAITRIKQITTEN